MKMENLSKNFEDTNISVLIENDGCQVVKVDGYDGDGFVTLYEVIDGILILYNDFHMTACPTPAAGLESNFSVEYCKEGRIEMQCDNNSNYYAEKGDFRIVSALHGSGKCYFPLSHYHGIGICMDKSRAQKSLKEEFPHIDIDLDKISKKFLDNGKTFSVHGDPIIETIFSQINELPKGVHKDYFKIKIIELLLHLKNMNIDTYRVERSYFNVTQVEKIKAIHALITSDLTKTYTCDELAEKFDISLTTMKRCFKGTYGSPIYAYLKNYRINNAANLLITRRDLKVSDIAAMVGYETPSKFTAVFHNIIGETPLEYRKTH